MDAPTQETPGATLANWRSPPHSRWAFRHVDQILPTAPIPNDAVHRMALPASTRSMPGFQIHRPGGAALSLEAFLRETHSDGFLVLADGEVVCEWRAPEMAVDTRHILMSASKSIVGLLCGVLAGRGVLEIDAVVSHYLPELAATGYSGASVRQLLDMRAQPALDEADLRAYTAATNWDPSTPDAAQAGLHDFYARLPARTTTHDGPFRYLSANTDLLGWVLERATGEPLAQLLSEYLWAPLGAQFAAQITLDRAGAPRATGGLCATLRDFARVGQLIINAGACGTIQVVPESWIDDIGQQGDRQAWAQGDFAQAFAGLRMHYRSGWYVIDDAPQTLFAMGIHGQHLFVDRANRLVIAKLSTQPLALDAKAIAWTLRAVSEVRRCILNP